VLSSSCCWVIDKVVGVAVGEVVEEEETWGWADVDSIGNSRGDPEDDFVEDSGTCCFCEIVE